ncbi:TPA: hypothetical protein N0F65_002090 [Lagenidium giganteum]|uniref:Endonuclease/exonuclease/phosphatase domain-containing protein n=1 Tax=Lagenidium giganteum TaxID=4803 RepID=A0AAV2ZBH6_9STRA|nr:TPA: hypothetical protein N0F65_002090 [Lagenidium giganteum]
MGVYSTVERFFREVLDLEPIPEPPAPRSEWPMWSSEETRENNEFKLRILSLNAWGIPTAPKCTERAAEIASAIENYEIVVLQEIWHRRERSLIISRAYDIGFHYYHYFHPAVGFPLPMGPDSFGTGLLVLSKFPLVNVTYHSFSLSGRPYALHEADFVANKGIGLLRVQTPAGQVDLFVTHLLANYNHLGKPGPGDRYLSHRTSQAYELAQFINATSKSNFAVVCGDFNSPSDCLVLRITRDVCQLRDAFTDMNSSDGLTFATEDNKFSHGEHPMRMDYILYKVSKQSSKSPRWQLTKSNVYKQFFTDDKGEKFPISDHFGVFAEFTFGTTRRRPCEQAFGEASKEKMSPLSKRACQTTTCAHCDELEPQTTPAENTVNCIQCLEEVQKSLLSGRQDAMERRAGHLRRSAISFLAVLASLVLRLLLLESNLFWVLILVLTLHAVLEYILSFYFVTLECSSFTELSNQTRNTKQAPARDNDTAMARPATTTNGANAAFNGNGNGSGNGAASKKRKVSTDEAAHAVVPAAAAAAALHVHRCRFIEWMPEAIHAMGFNAAGDQLAVARGNGDLEIWSVDRKWHLKYVISGSAKSKISAHVTDSNGGPIWCMEINNAAESLAVGCEDGRIRIFSFEHDDLYFRKGFVTTGRRIVSLAWHAGSNRMFSGSEDGIIHCWNALNGRNESRITLESLAKQKCIVWSLLVLDDLTIVSGDSHGNLSLWNGRTGTLVQKFSHLTADILALCVDKANTTLFASGVDNQVVELRRVADHESSWAYSYSHRAHSHDVRALALSNAAQRPVLVSGGVDTQLVWYRADSFNVHRPTKIASMPHRKTVSLASEQRVLLVQKSTSLDLWRLAPAAHGATDSNDQAQHKLLVEIQMSDAFNLACSALAPNGAFVACSTAKEVKLFSLDTAAGFLPSKLSLPAAATESARALAFSPDSTRLVIASESHKIRVIDLKRMEVLKTFDAAADAAPIVSLSISVDGQWLGTGDAHNTISIYNLDSMQLYCHLPRPSEMHTSIGFNPSGKLLVVTLVSNSFVCYDIENKGLSAWYRRNHQNFPKELVEGRNIKGMTFDPAHPDVLYLYSQSSLYQINMNEAAAEAAAAVAIDAARQARKARHRGASVASESDAKTATEDDTLVNEHNGFCRVINRYRPLSFVDFLAENELIVVETPWLKVLSRLPGALQRHKYGK